MRIEKAEALAADGVVRKHLGTSASVWLFGSRADDTQKGGDVDLVVNNHTKKEAIYDVAKSKGVRLA